MLHRRRDGLRGIRANGEGKSERPARERIGPAFSETAIQQNTREWGGGKAKGRPESDQPYLPAYCPCYRVGSIAGLVVCTIASTPSLVTVPDLVAARVRGATDLDRACHTNPKESGGPLTAADEQERAMLRARVDETVKALTCPPGYGAIEEHRGRPVHGFNLHGAPSRSASADLENLCSQPHGRDCGDRSLCGSDNHVPATRRHLHAGSHLRAA